MTVRDAEIFPTGHMAPLGIKHPDTESPERTMPPSRFEEVVLPHLDAAFNYAPLEGADCGCCTSTPVVATPAPIPAA